MISYEAMMAAKIVMLEGIVRDLLVNRFNSMDDPIGNAKIYAETRWQPRTGATIEPDLELARQAVWREFLDSVVAGVHKTQEG
jgi:hypothetical protein